MGGGEQHMSTFEKVRDIVVEQLGVEADDVNIDSIEPRIEAILSNHEIILAKEDCIRIDFIKKVQ